MASKEELDFVVKYGPYSDKRVLEIGSSIEYSMTTRAAVKAKEYVTVDMRPHKCTQIVHNMNEPLEIDPFDVILIISVLEHAEKPWLVAENAARILKPGGTMLISVPFAWRVHDHPDDFWRFTPSAIHSIFPGFKWIEESTSPPGIKVTDHPKAKLQLYFAGVKE